MNKLLLFFLPFVALLSGCASFHASKTDKDGNILAVDSTRLFVQDDVGAIDFGQAGNDTKLTVQGIKSQSQLQLEDVINQLAKVIAAARP